MRPTRNRGVLRLAVLVALVAAVVSAQHAPVAATGQVRVLPARRLAGAHMPAWTATAARASSRRQASAALAAPAGRVAAQPRQGSFLAASACPMAHCAPQMGNQEPITIPTAGVSSTWTFSRTGYTNHGGLGCTVGPTVVLCTGTTANWPVFTYDQPYMYALDPLTGHELWDTGKLLNGSVIYGVPLIGANGNSFISDDNYLASFDAQGHPRWRVTNPATAAITSWNITGDGHLVGLGRRGPLLVVNPNNGNITGSIALTATIRGVSGTYVTTNNTVSVLGNRVYPLTQWASGNGEPGPGAGQTEHILDPQEAQPYTNTSGIPGRLYAIDVVSGVPQVAWHWDFVGPSGGSPLTLANPTSATGAVTGTTIYCDGLALHQGDPLNTYLFAVRDLGSSPSLLWKFDFTTQANVPFNGQSMETAASHDPRGGVWAHVSPSSDLYRFDEVTGLLVETIDLSQVPELGRTARPASVMMIVSNSGRPVGILTARASGPIPIIELDLTSKRLDWQWPSGYGGGPGAFPCQFPIAQVGGQSVVIGEQTNGNIYGLLLH